MFLCIIGFLIRRCNIYMWHCDISYCYEYSEYIPLRSWVLSDIISTCHFEARCWLWPFGPLGPIAWTILQIYSRYLFPFCSKGNGWLIAPKSWATEHLLSMFDPRTSCTYCGGDIEDNFSSCGLAAALLLFPLGQTMLSLASLQCPGLFFPPPLISLTDIERHTLGGRLLLY